MIITCPSCAAQYIVPEDAVSAKGRRVKCTTCDYTWLQYPDTPEEPKLDEDQGVEPTEEKSFESYLEAESVTIAHDDESYDDAHASEIIRQARRTMEIENPAFSAHQSAARHPIRKVVLDGFVYALCALIITGILLVSFSHRVVSAWPESALFYDMIGMPVSPPGHGIQIQDLKIATTATESESGDIAITGKLVNSSDNYVRLPTLRVRANGANGWLKDWTINLQGKVLSAGKEATLDYLLQDAPAGTTTATLIFID